MIEREREILAQWARLGVTLNVSPSSRSPALEQLIVRSMELVPDNPRVIVLVGSWLSVFWRCVGRDRLSAVALQSDIKAQSTLGLMLDTVDRWLDMALFRGVAAKLTALSPAEPLLNIDRNRPELRRLIEVEASDLSRRWGVLCLPIERRPDAIRPVEWVLRRNRSLRTRSLFKGTLKTSLLELLEQRGPAASITQLARDCGVTRKAVYDAMEDLAFSGLIVRPPAGVHSRAS